MPTKRRWRRAIILTGCGSAAVLCTLIVVVLNPRIVGSYLAAQIGQTAGGTVTIESFAWTGWAAAEIKGVRLLAPDWKGPGSEVAHIDRLHVELDLLSIVWGRTTIRRIQMSGLLLKVTEDPDHGGTYNFQKLRPAASNETSGDSIMIEHASIVDCGVSFQRVKADQVREMYRITTTAELIPSPVDPSVSMIDVRQPDGEFHLEGWWNQTTLAFELSAKGLSVDDNLGLAMPRALRALVEQADAAGSVKSATLAMAPGKPIRCLLELADFRATLPLDTFETWVHYENGAISAARGYPQIRLRTGTFELLGTRLECRGLDFELVNTAGAEGVATLPVRASLSLDFGALMGSDFQWKDRMQWAERVRAVAPFKLNLSVPKFSLGKATHNNAIEVPRSVAEIMRTFTVKELAFAVELEASRAPPSTDSNGELIAQPLASSGKLIITDGEGAFDDFPYPIRGIQADIDFAGSNAHISDLRGFGPGGETVIINGSITNMGPELGVDLSISAESLPIDHTLFNSFPEVEQKLLSDLFWQAGFESLQNAGVLFDSKQIDEAVSELSNAETRLATLTAPGAPVDPDEIADLSTRAGHLRRIINHGAFTPGGRLSLDLHIAQAESNEVDVDITGTIRILHADLLATTFPYPIRAKGGQIVLYEDRIDFGDGITFETFDGAKGTFDGRIDLVDAARNKVVRPQLHFSLKDDRLNPLLYMAIPPGPDENAMGWPGKTLSRGGTIISQLSPLGVLSLNGEIEITKNGNLDVVCDIELRGGSIHPSVPTEEIIADEGIVWPIGFGLDDCSGSFRLAENSVFVRSFTGFRRDGKLDASGRLSLDGNSTDLSIRLSAIDLADYAINLLPFDKRGNSTELWDRYEPTGRFDAEILIETPPSGGDPFATVKVEPKVFGITLPAGKVEVKFDTGTLTVEGEHIRCDSLSGTIGSSGGTTSQICVDGSYGTDTGELDLSAWVENGLIHGPLIDEIFERIDAEGAKSFLEEFRPEGRYNAQLAYSIAAGSSAGSFEIDAWLLDLSLGSSNARLSLGFPVPAYINARGDSLKVSPFRAVFPGGSINAHGWMSTDEDGKIDDGEFDLKLHAIGTGEHVIGALPIAARDPLVAIGFACRDILKANVNMRMGTRGDLTHLDIDANVSLHDASINVGPDVSRFTAEMDMRVSTDAESTSFSAEVTDARVNIAGRSIDDITARLGKQSEDSFLLITDFHGSLSTGVIVASATIETKPPFAYETDIILSGVPLEALIIEGDGVDMTSAAPALDPGLVDARIGMSGDGDGLLTRRGRGCATIQQAELAKLPIGIAILQITQLSLSLNPVVQRGDFAFTIDQDRLQFQEFNLSCNELSLAGEGWLNTESTELALRLKNRGKMPIISDILGGITNQLFQIDVRGTIAEPVGSIAPLPGLIPPPQLKPSGPVASTLR